MGPTMALRATNDLPGSEVRLQSLWFVVMIVVGLLAHGEPPTVIPKLGNVAHVEVAVNARPAPAPTPWFGFGANHNRLMDKFDDAEWYVALNADVDLSSEQLQTLLEQADAHGYSLVAPLRREPWGAQGEPDEALPTPGYFLRTAFVPARFQRRGRAMLRTSGSMVDASWIGGSCMAMRGDLLRDLRFDERYFMYFEDVDLGQRAKLLGARIGVCTSVTVDHAVGWRQDDPLISRRGVEYARSARAYAEAHGHSPRTMRAAALAHASLRMMVPGRSPAARAANRAVAGGLALRSRPGLSELAAIHNARYGLEVSESPAPR
jgi:N-acetylglucosaminyl-diphospho-decaprenol L-rhamnosyltransferase